MALESVTYINTLDPNLPSSTDGLDNADDHIRNLKRAIRDTFPNVTGPVTATAGQLSQPFPIGGIIIWSGQINTIPAGWALCDGRTVARSDGGGNITTPDLTDRFLVGAGRNYGVTATGGNIAAGVYTSIEGAHTHAAGCDLAGAHSHTGVTAGHAITPGQMPRHAHRYGAAFVGGGGGNGLYFPSQLGIYADATFTEEQGNNESHDHGIVADGTHAHRIEVYGTGAHQHTVNIPDMRPPFYALAYLMRS